MGLINHFRKNKNKQDNKKDENQRTLAEDIPIAAKWAIDNLNKTGYSVDYNLESMKEVERFFNDNTGNGRKLPGNIVFALGCLVGETIIKLGGGVWQTDDKDPKGEITVAVVLENNSIIWPVLRCIKRNLNGPEENIYDYVRSMLNLDEEAKIPGIKNNKEE